MKMKTFVECYDNETNDEDEVVIVPFEKPVPPLIILAESDNESDSQPKSPDTKRRRINFAADVEPDLEFLEVTQKVTSEDPTPKHVRKSSKRKKQSKEKTPPDDDEDWDWNISFLKTRTLENALPTGPTPPKQREGHKSDPPMLPTTQTSSSDNQQAGTSDKRSSPSPSKKPFCEESREEFIRFAASLGLPVLTPESQEELIRHGPPDISEVLVIDNENDHFRNTDDAEEDEDDCVIIDEEPELPEREEELFQTLPNPAAAAGPMQDAEPEPLNSTKIEPEDIEQEQEPELIRTPPAPTSNRSVFPPTWNLEMQHFYGDERPNFSRRNIQRKQSNDVRLWVMREGGQNNRKRPYILCNNCNQRGHVLRQCPEKIKGLICWMCGEHGDHQVERCPKKMCLNCGSNSKQFQYPCRNCDASNYRYSSVLTSKCAVCDMDGHLDGRCPDNWRRFHSTTVTLRHDVTLRGESVLGKAIGWKVNNNGKCEYRRKNRSSCANCGRKGHNYFQCKGNRANSSSFINTPFIIHELNKAELEELEQMSTSSTKTDSAKRVDQDVFDTPSAPRLPNFHPKTEKVVTLNQTDYELLRDGYEQKMPAALIFFSCHIHNIIKIIPREKTMDIHLNGANENNVDNAKRDLLNTLTKLGVAKGLVSMEHASTKNLPAPTSEGFQFLLDTLGDKGISAHKTPVASVLIKGDGDAGKKSAESAVTNQQYDDITEEPNNLYLKTALSQMVPNPLFGREIPKQVTIACEKHDSDAETDDGFLREDDTKQNSEKAPGREKEVEIDVFEVPVKNRDEYCQSWVNCGANVNRSQRFHPTSGAAPDTINFDQQHQRSDKHRDGPGKWRKDNVRYPDAEHSRSFYQHRKRGKSPAQFNRGSRSGTGTGTQGSSGSRIPQQPKPRAPRYFD